MVFNRRREEPPPEPAWDDPTWVPQPVERWIEPEEVAERLRRRRGRWRALRHAVVLLLIIVVVGGTGVIAGGAVLGRWELPWSPSPISAAVPTASGPVVDPLDCEPAVVVPASIAGTSVRVLNATSQSGLAGSTADVLEARGFTVVGVGNYAGDVPEPSRVRFPEEAEPAALIASAQLLGAVLEPTSDVDVVTVVIGDQWPGLATEAVAAEQAAQPQPSVVDCAGA